MKKFRKGDLVVVTTGKDKGKSGQILLVDIKNEKLVIEGVNQIIRHKKQAQDIPGGRIKENGPINLSNVLHMCPKTKRPTRISIKRLDDGKKVRISVCSGESIER